MEDDIPVESLEARLALVPEQSNLRKVTYRVRRGDTLSSVARRWNVATKDVILWNGLTSPNLFAGQRLELTVPTKAKKGRSTSKSGTAKRSSARVPSKANRPL